MDEDRIIAPVSEATARQYLAKYQPDLTVHTLNYLGGGSSSIFAVNDTLIFRFPKLDTEEVEALFNRYAAALDTIRGHVVPHQVSKALDRLPPDETIFPRAVDVYAFLPGTQMAKLNPTPQQERTLAAHLGDFLSKLHATTTITGVGRTTVPALKQSWFRQYEQFRQAAYPRLTEDEHDWLVQVFEDFLVDADAMTPPIVLVHGDFGDENVLVPVHFQHLNVIDFEGLSYGDPMGEFCLWWGERGEDFFDGMMNVYTGQIDAHFHQRMRFYFNRIPLFYFNLSLITGSDHFFEFGRDLLQQRMRRPG